MRCLRIAVTKGRILKETISLFEKIGLDTEPIKKGGRKLVFDVSGMQVVTAKPADVITFVERGSCDLGIVGKDTIMECGRSFYEVLDLGFGKCRFALAAPKGVDFYGGYGMKTVATKYPNVAKKFFIEKTMDVEIIKIDGSVELAPLIGLTEAIVDLVETGNTLRANGLEILEEIAPVSTRVIVNMASMKLNKSKIEAFLKQVEGCVCNI